MYTAGLGGTDLQSQQRQSDLSEFKARLVCRVSFRIARTIQKDPVSKKKKKKKNTHLLIMKQTKGCEMARLVKALAAILAT